MNRPKDTTVSIEVERISVIFYSPKPFARRAGFPCHKLASYKTFVREYLIIKHIYTVEYTVPLSRSVVRFSRTQAMSQVVSEDL